MTQPLPRLQKTFFPFASALLKIRAVAEKEMLVLVVKIIRRAPPVGHRKIKVAGIIRRRIKAHPRRRPHEQRVAPRPVFTCPALWLREFEALHLGRFGKNGVKFFAQRRNHLVFAVEKIKFRPGLPDAMVVGVVKTARRVSSCSSRPSRAWRRGISGRRKFPPAP